MGMNCTLQVSPGPIGGRKRGLVPPRDDPPTGMLGVACAEEVVLGVNEI